MMAFFTTIPASAMTPIMDVALKNVPLVNHKIAKPINTPMSAKGMVAIMSSGAIKDLNCNTSTK